MELVELLKDTVKEYKENALKEASRKLDVIYQDIVRDYQVDIVCLAAAKQGKTECIIKLDKLAYTTPYLSEIMAAFMVKGFKVIIEEPKTIDGPVTLDLCWDNTRRFS
jgi:hypothetical protein